MNVGRVPQCGRNFEYLSGEDPYLGYALVKGAIVGIQSQGVLATVKHFVLNNQEARESVSTTRLSWWRSILFLLNCKSDLITMILEI